MTDEQLREALLRLLSGAFQPPEIDQTFAQALKRLQNPSAFSNMKYRDRLTGTNLNGTDPELIKFGQAFVKRLQEYSVPFFIHGAYRDGKEQEALLARGVTKAGAGQSPHNHGYALDIVHWGFYWELTRKEWELVGEIGKDLARTRNIKITWGGDFKSIWDPAHWELTDWRSRV